MGCRGHFDPLVLISGYANTENIFYCLNNTDICPHVSIHEALAVNFFSNGYFNSFSSKTSMAHIETQYPSANQLALPQY